MASLNINAFEVAVDEISVNIVSSDTISAIKSASFLNCRHSNSTDVNTTAQKKQVGYFAHSWRLYIVQRFIEQVHLIFTIHDDHDDDKDGDNTVLINIIIQLIVMIIIIVQVIISTIATTIISNNNYDI